MKSILKMFLLTGCLSVVYNVSAQILPPDFVCIKGDTLIWAPTPNACGPFQSYILYTADNRQGPYSVLTQITNPATNKYFHANPLDLARYYFLETAHDCPGEIRIPSDTLDNRVPEINEVSSVSVEGANVRVRWEANVSPETEAYIIYRRTPIGTIPIDTVFGALDYLDTTADPLNQSETYFVKALDPCGNSSLFGEPHSTMNSSVSIVECSQEITLTWNGYENWPQGIDYQEVWASIDGAAPVALDTISAAATEYVFSDPIDNAEYCFFVKAVAAGVGFAASSNVNCISADVIQPVTGLYIKNLDVQPDGRVEVTWSWNDDAELAGAEVHHGLQSDTSRVISNVNLNFPLIQENQFTIDNPTGNEGALSVRIKTFDTCDTIVTSAAGNQIFLRAAPASGLTNLISWTPLQIENLEVTSYDVFKTANGTSQNVGSVNGDVLVFSDELSPQDVTGAELCYFVRATSILTRPDGSEETITSNSNQSCIAQSVRVFMPNAFSPRGRNQVFKPVVSYGVPKAYQMQIFNRWGENVFQSSEINVGWNGKIGQRDAPSAVYTYLIQITRQDDSVENITGSVMLVR